MCTYPEKFGEGRSSKFEDNLVSKGPLKKKVSNIGTSYTPWICERQAGRAIQELQFVTNFADALVRCVRIPTKRHLTEISVMLVHLDSIYESSKVKVTCVYASTFTVTG